MLSVVNHPTSQSPKNIHRNESANVTRFCSNERPVLPFSKNAQSDSLQNDPNIPLSQKIEDAKIKLNEIQENNKMLTTKIMNGASLKKRLNEVYQKMCKYDKMGEKERRKVLKVKLSGNRDFSGPKRCLPTKLPNFTGKGFLVSIQKRLHHKF